MIAGEVLDLALVKLAAEGLRVRCGDWMDGTNPWLSDDPRLRAMAARWCTGCPVMSECGAAAEERKETFGVWGGRDRTPRPKAANA